jgi:hypothetical protein
MQSKALFFLKNPAFSDWFGMESMPRRIENAA